MEEKEEEKEGTQRLVVSLSATTLNQPTGLPPVRPLPSDPAVPTTHPTAQPPRTEDKNQYERVAISL